MREAIRLDAIEAPRATPAETVCPTALYPSPSLRISRKHALRARRVLELALRSKPVLSIETVCIAAIDVDRVGPASDVFRRYDHEPRRMCVINHGNNLSAHGRQARGVSLACGVRDETPGHQRTPNAAREMFQK